MTRDRLFGAVGRALVRFGPAGVRRWAWDRVWWRPIDYTARTADRLRMRGHTADLIQRYVYYFGQWEPAISRWFRGYVGPGDVVVDVRANVGWYTLLAAKCVGPTGRVIAVEASPSIAARLRENLALNPTVASRVTVHNCAAGDRDGAVPVYLADAENTGKTSLHADAGATAEGTVPMKPLAALLAGVELPRVRVIKIDVEGAEPQVIAGLLPLAAELPAGAAVLVETAEECRAAVVADLTTAGFTVAGFFPNVYKPEPYLSRRHEPFVETGAIPPIGQWDVLFVKG
jgi:FkbM family methyltransferase